jgi:hypothetical protein
LSKGVASDTDRQELVNLAKEFKEAGDAALAYEKEAPQGASDPIFAATAPAPSTAPPAP